MISRIFGSLDRFFMHQEICECRCQLDEEGIVQCESNIWFGSYFEKAAVTLKGIIFGIDHCSSEESLRLENADAL